MINAIIWDSIGILAIERVKAKCGYEKFAQLPPDELMQSFKDEVVSLKNSYRNLDIQRTDLNNDLNKFRMTPSD